MVRATLCINVKSDGTKLIMTRHIPVVATQDQIDQYRLELTKSFQVSAEVDEDVDQANSQLIKTMMDAAKKANPTCNKSQNKFSATTLSLMNRRNDLIIRNSEDLLEKRDVNKTIHKRQRTETRAYNQRIVETTIKERKGYKTAKKKLAIDYKKAFDSVEHQAVLNGLNAQNIPPAYIRMLDQIFRLGTSNIKFHTNTNVIRLEKRVRQGDSISPKLFTACLENVFRGLNWTSKGIPINGDRLTNLRFADDVVLLSESPQELQLMVEELRTASSKVGLEINLMWEPCRRKQHTSIYKFIFSDDGIYERYVVVPENLFLLLSLIIGDNESEERRQKIIIVAQDIIFVASNGKKLTPKHIGLAVTVHHATRSKSLVQLLHSAGHCVSYECVTRIDATMAKKEVERWKSNGDLVIPPNLKPGDFVQFSGDNINVHVETLDGKGMLNATQYAAFQYGEGSKSTSDDSKIIGKEKSIGSSIPPEFHAILPSGYMRSKRPFPDMDIAWYGPDPSIAAQSHAKDLTWIQCRLQDLSQQVIPAWTGFNHVTSQFESEVTRLIRGGGPKGRLGRKWCIWRKYHLSYAGWQGLQQSNAWPQINS
ncbi:Retrovirus-related Pol polyprotein from type-1 retrotransposable element R2 [Nymphon striatum]|nr:Retrovirus-related Pol polyprotein from type-1 retrotransposable element R2 [Nymphon striatum]